MKRTFLTRSAALVALIALSACSGSGVPDVLPDVPEAAPEPAFDPIPDLRDAHYQEALGLSLDQHTRIASVAALNAEGASQRVGSVSLVTDPDRRVGYQYTTDAVELAVAWEGSSDLDTVDYLYVPVGDDFFEEGFTRVLENTNAYGDRVLIVEHEANGRRLYIPSEDSGVFVGAFSTNFDDEDLVAHAVFGRETLTDEVTRLTGSARFDGLSEASVIANSAASGSIDRSGSYRGISGGSVDFETGNFDLAATMEHEGNGHQIGLSAHGVMTADGAMVSSASFYNLLDGDGEVEGNFDGQLFGPNGSDIGATFSGETGEPGNSGFAGQSASVAGQMILSR